MATPMLGEPVHPPQHRHRVPSDAGRSSAHLEKQPPTFPGLGREVTGLLEPGLGTWAPGVAHWSLDFKSFLAARVRESGIPSLRLPPPKADFKSRTSRGAHGPTCSSF